jgi:hypothetical protein
VPTQLQLPLHGCLLSQAAALACSVCVLQKPRRRSMRLEVTPQQQPQMRSPSSAYHHVLAAAATPAHHPRPNATALSSSGPFALFPARRQPSEQAWMRLLQTVMPPQLHLSSPLAQQQQQQEQQLAARDARSDRAASSAPAAHGGERGLPRAAPVPRGAKL